MVVLAVVALGFQRHLAPNSPREIARGKELALIGELDGNVKIWSPRGEHVARAPLFMVAKGANLPAAKQTRVPDPARFTATAATVCDFDGDKREEAFIAWSYDSYSTRAATPVVYRYWRDKADRWQEEEVWRANATIRPTITSLSSGDVDGDGRCEIAISAFRSTFVSGGYLLWWFAGQSGWQQVLHDSHLGIHRVFADLDGNGRDELYVGKVYAVPMKDPPKGWRDDVYLYQDPLKGGAEGRFIEDDLLANRLPTFQGIKDALIAADLNGDGRDELYAGDGWHAEYGRRARAQVAQITLKKGKFAYRIIEEIDTPTTYRAVNLLRAVQMPGSGPILLARVPWSTAEAYKMGHRYSFYKPNGSEWFVTRRNPNDPAVDPPPAKWSRLKPSIGDRFSDSAALIGRPAPEIRAEEWLNARQGSKLADFRGKVVLLDFWATWCKPCIAEMPNMLKLREEFGPRGLEIIGVTENRETQVSEQVRKFVKEHPLPYPVAISSGAANSFAYGVSAIPHVFVVDRKGVLRFQIVGGGKPEELRKAVRKLIEEK